VCTLAVLGMQAIQVRDPHQGTLPHELYFDDKFVFLIKLRDLANLSRSGTRSYGDSFSEGKESHRIVITRKW